MTDPTGSPAPETPRTIVVLLVDDQAFVGTALKMLLHAERDIDLHSCLVPADAIAMADRIDPALVLVDLVMPGIDGLTLVRAFRSHPQTAGTPVVVLSANDGADLRAGALAAGADGFLVKLPPKPELVACIRYHASQSAGGQQTLDLAVMDVFHDADTADFTRNLIDLFLRDASAKLEAVKVAAARADGAAVSVIVHSLKGSSSIMGCTRLAALCGRIEMQMKAAPGSDVAPALVTELDHEFARVRQALAVQRDNSGQP